MPDNNEPLLLPEAIHESTFDMGEVHEISLEIMELLEADQIDVPTGTVALAMTLGRCMSPATLEQPDEIAFIRAVLEFGHVYFAAGRAN